METRAKQPPPVRTKAFVGKTCVLMMILACATAPAPALALDSYVTFASSHTWRGVLLSDGPTVLLGGEQALGTGNWSAGAWGAGVDRAWPFGATDGGLLAGAYLARDWQCGTHCSARATLSRYLFPGSAPGGWTEVAVSARWKERVGFNLARARSDGDGARSRTFELFAEQPLGPRWSAELLLGHTGYSGYRYRYAELDLRRSLARWQVSIGCRYGETQPPYGAARHRARLVVSFSRVF